MIPTNSLLSKPFRIVFAGTPEFAATILVSLLENSRSRSHSQVSTSAFEVVAVYSQPDRPAGRGRKQRVGAVKQVALDAGLPIYQPESLKAPEQQAELAELDADVMVVVAYGLILPIAILQTPKRECINVHASLLPRWRGAAPIQRAIIAGDQQTGVTIMQMEKGLDTGPMLHTSSIDIRSDDTAQSLHDRLAILGAETLLQTLDDMINDRLKPIVQDDSLSNYAQKLSKTEAAIDWSRSARIIERQVFGFNPWPVAFCQLDGEPLRIWKAKAKKMTSSENTNLTPGKVLSQSADGIEVTTGEGVLLLTEIQLPGKRAVAVQDFINSRNLVGQVLR